MSQSQESHESQAHPCRPPASSSESDKGLPLAAAQKPPGIPQKGDAHLKPGLCRALTGGSTLLSTAQDTSKFHPHPTSLTSRGLLVVQGGKSPSAWTQLRLASQWPSAGQLHETFTLVSLCFLFCNTERAIFDHHRQTSGRARKVGLRPP